MRPQKIFVARHGESQEDVDPSCKTSFCDKEIALTTKGVLQAEALAARVGRAVKHDASCVRIFSSPSKRAFETAGIVANKTSFKELIIDPRIRNLNWGDTTPENVATIAAERYKAGVLCYKFPGGDDSKEVVRGVEAFVRDLLELQNRDEGISVVITHGFALRLIAKHLLGMSDQDFRWIRNPPNCHLVEFTVLGEGRVTIDKPLPLRDPL